MPKVAYKNITVVKDEKLSTYGDERFIVVDNETGEVLDDAQGYGYKTIKKAYRGFGYKNRTDEEKDKHNSLMKTLNSWSKKNRKVLDEIEDCAFYAWKDGEKFKLDDKLLTEILTSFEIKIEELPFQLKDFIKNYKNIKY